MASITIVFELDETSDRPCGSAHLPDGTSREFHGWLGLAEAVDALARADGDPARGHHQTNAGTDKESSK
jgi:hypothetical protein